MVIIFVAGVYFAFVVLDAQTLLERQWPAYINPFNQFYIFAGGILIGHFVDERDNFFIKSPLAIYLIVLLVVAFCFYPVHGDVINIVTGWPRIIFSSICFLLCLVIYTSEIKMNESVHRALSFVGATSYSIYLIHPIIFKILKAVNEALLILNPAWLFPIAVGGTLLASGLSYRYFEKPIIQIGARLTSQLKNQPVG
jgi:peptidoglycan/LPS O-acetylase OafA/YrhL